jgi:hypothetical protein
MQQAKDTKGRWNKSHSIQGLKWAKAARIEELHPILSGKSNKKGLAGKGTRFETKFIKQLKELIMEKGIDCKVGAGVWFKFEDEVKVGFCQVDCLLVFPTYAIILECKLTQTKLAWEQLTKLYHPIVSHILKRPVYTMQVCCNLQVRPNLKVWDLEAFIKNPKEGLWTYHSKLL